MTEVVSIPQRIDKVINNGDTSAPVNVRPESSDPCKLQLAYGRLAVPKLVAEIRAESLQIRQHAFISLADLFHNPEYISQGLHENIVPKITELFSSDRDSIDITIKQKASECFASISGYAHGRNALIAENSLYTISNLFDDNDPMVRKNVHTIFANCTLQQAGVDAILPWVLLDLTQGAIATLIQKLLNERTDIQTLMLKTLYNCIRMGSPAFMPKDAIKCEAMEVFTDLLSPYAVTQVKVGAAKCIMMLRFDSSQHSFFPQGKKIAVGGQTLPILIDTLLDFKAEVRAAAAGALMSISIDVDAKRLLVRENALPMLMKLLEEKNDSVLLNAIKTITNCAEDYRGRFQLHGCLKKLEAFSTSRNSQLAEAAKTAIKVITWRP